MTSLFPAPVLTETEQDILIEIFQNPVMKKYLRIMALNDLVELGELSATNRSTEELAIAHATIRGKLSVLQTQFSIIKE